MTVVMIDARYAYEAPFPVKVGDMLELPATWASPGGWRGMVTAIGSDGYTGPLKTAIRNLSQPEQLSIPTDEPKARLTDPVTSQKAAGMDRMKRDSQRAKLLRAFYDGQGGDGLTDEQAASRAAVRGEYATRCSELRNAGLIEFTGKERKGAAGAARAVSEITSAGAGLVRARGWR